jgi:hypothetical protein
MATLKNETIGADGLSVRARNCINSILYPSKLGAHDPHAVLTRTEAVQVSKFSKTDVKKWPNCGSQTTNLIEKWLTSHKLLFETETNSLAKRVSALEREVKKYKVVYRKMRSSIAGLDSALQAINFHILMMINKEDSLDKERHSEYAVNCVNGAKAIIVKLNADMPRH